MRLFVALEIPLAIRQQLDRRTAAARGELPKARWVKPEAMHLTLVFLGSTAAARLPGLHRELETAFTAVAPMTLRVEGFGAFPARGRRRVAWAGIEADGDLAGLKERAERAAEKAVGHEPERRPFHPHLTLARLKPPWPAAAVGRLGDAFGPEPSAGFAVDHGTLFESQLHPSGARYKVVRTYPLGGAA